MKKIEKATFVCTVEGKFFLHLIRGGMKWKKNGITWGGSY
jgi:hypothetical protein